MSVSKETADVMRALSRERHPLNMTKPELDAAVTKLNARFEKLSDSEIARRIEAGDVSGMDEIVGGDATKTIVLNSLNSDRMKLRKVKSLPMPEPEMIDILVDAARVAGWDLDAAKARLRSSKTARTFGQS